MSSRRLSFSNSDSSLQSHEQCELCNDSDTKFTRPQQWRITTSLLIAPDAPVWQACRRDELDLTLISHLDGRKWKVKGENVQCTAEVFVSSKSIPMETFQSGLVATGLKSQVTPITSRQLKLKELHHPTLETDPDLIQQYYQIIYFTPYTQYLVATIICFFMHLSH